MEMARPGVVAVPEGDLVWVWDQGLGEALEESLGTAGSCPSCFPKEECCRYCCSSGSGCGCGGCCCCRWKGESEGPEKGINFHSRLQRFRISWSQYYHHGRTWLCGVADHDGPLARVSSSASSSSSSSSSRVTSSPSPLSRLMKRQRAGDGREMGWLGSRKPSIVLYQTYCKLGSPSSIETNCRVKRWVETKRGTSPKQKEWRG